MPVADGENRIVKRTACVLIIAASALLAACSGNEEQKAKELVGSFYQMHQSARPSGALSLNELISFRHFLSVPLFDLLKDASVADETRKANATAAASDAAADTDSTDDAEPAPPLLDGDIFTANPAGASTFRVVNCEMQERDSVCAVELVYSDARLKAPTKWTDHVQLTRDARGWVIDNVEYAKGAAPMRSGNLQDTLRRALKRDTPVL